MSRVRITDDKCWPERFWCVGTVVTPTPEQAKVYPFAGLGKDKVVVLLDDDPLGVLEHDLLVDGDAVYDWWSCVLIRNMFEYIPDLAGHVAVTDPAEQPEK